MKNGFLILLALSASMIAVSCSNVGTSDSKSSMNSETTETSEITQTEDTTDSVTEMTQIQESSENEITETEAADTTDSTEYSGSDESGFEFSVTETSIEISKNGSVIQTLTGNYVDTYSGELITADLLTHSDYDFDGYDDLFIPTNTAVSNISGIYYRYNPDTGLFESWDELNKIGYLMNINDDGTLTWYMKDNAVNYDKYIYNWSAQLL